MTFLSDLASVLGWTALIMAGSYGLGYTVAFVIACLIELGEYLNRLVEGGSRE